MNDLVYFMIPLMEESVTGDPINSISEYIILGIRRYYQLHTILFFPCCLGMEFAPL